MPIVIRGEHIYSMLLSGGKALGNQVASVDALNVFPVPDGDTGTNMNLSFVSGIQEIQAHSTAQDSFGDIMSHFARGIMMGARGNSGVILSQIFRGISQHTKKMTEVNGEDFALALEKGVEVAYKAVMKPVEGTILTVIRESAKTAAKFSRRANSVEEVLKAAIEQAELTLSQTPEMLPVLKEVGVVDAGGKGLVIILQGMYEALTGEQIEYRFEQQSSTSLPQQSNANDDTDGYGYCTEFIIKNFTRDVSELEIRNTLSEQGDSLLVVKDDDFVKIHIHTLDPGKVLSYAGNVGSLHRIKIDNMTEQHNHLSLKSEALQTQEQAKEASAKQKKNYGIVTVTNGEGVRDIFLSIGADEIVFGGQSMNPSTEDLAKAVKNINADTVFILPNNKNIILASEQVVNVIEDKQVIVIPSKTIPEGIAAILAFHEDQEVDDNIEVMKEAMTSVVSGQVTYAVRDTQINGNTIQEGDFLGIVGSEIAVNGQDLMGTTLQLLDRMIDKDAHEIITIFTGFEVAADQTEVLKSQVAEAFPDLELEVKEGLQPTYYFIISVE
ncbi:hypothetical protein BHU72_02990 [Desulfuribacillus stibiiarsenatis]|uniref:DhaL domain-containing protein n=1 Tax=Desulfuribacillus stibiiarsenatis TaxID=1390249 RepID=A0A1E5L721_9FIRM|nr:DAK2 domain-containing protein [Desulfuribacillus stibiiarsenatis]OEH85763.1 hypothetical protein BHU72_02990 [Desulfuribacillus stibiiarsenatis]